MAISVRTRAAFTLIELLVAMSIFVVLASLAISGFQIAGNSDRVGEAASTLRAKLEGARSRSIKAREIRGVRLIVDPIDSAMSPDGASLSRTVTSVGYLDAPQVIEGYARIECLNQSVLADDGSDMFGRWSIFSSTHKSDEVVYYNWNDLHKQGLIAPGSRVVIGGTSYQLEKITRLRVRENGAYLDEADYAWVINPSVLGSYDAVPGNEPEFEPAPSTNGFPNSKRPFEVDPAETEASLVGFDGSPHGLSSAAASIPLKYRLYLVPQLLEGTAATKLPRNTTIDLRGSKIPAGWRQAIANGGDALDILFTPQGRVNRELLGEGYLHLRIADITDMREAALLANIYSGYGVADLVMPRDPVYPGKLVTLVTQTGMLRISNVNGEGGVDTPEEPNDEVMTTNSTDPQRDPFFYAIFGREAK